jgi:A/G-specific adenine glycosylase
MKSFAARLLKWFDRHGRHDLPWQHPRDAYCVWLAEVMLQQTQVATVIPYFGRFLARFPDLRTLAEAPLDDVLALWSGLGYYARARNLHRCAQVVVGEHRGEFPRDLDTLTALPGLGRSTAAAILAQAFGQRHAILDGNVRRVLARHGGVSGWPGLPNVQRKLWTLAESHLPATRLPDYTQALMDLGATLCTARKPSCEACPLRADCVALATDRVAQLPSLKPRRERPSRSAHVLLIRNEAGELLLERRPPVGIWGGLWSLPMVDGHDDWHSHPLIRRSGESRNPVAARRTVLPVIAHSFTHFDLSMQPIELRLVRASAIAESPDQRWTTIPAAARLGLPAPIRRLLLSLDE